MFIHIGLVAWGFALWAGGTLAVRLVGERLFRPGDWTPTLLLFLASVPLMAIGARRLCRAAGLAREHWPAGAVSLVLPTVLLDPFSCVFFARVFPNIPPEAAGVFGGWLLGCCAGALLGVVLGR